MKLHAFSCLRKDSMMYWIIDHEYTRIKEETGDTDEVIYDEMCKHFGVSRWSIINARKIFGHYGNKVD